jgi:hypothetical protein
MIDKGSNRFGFNAPGDLVLPASAAASGLQDPTRRKSLMQIAGLAGAAISPFGAKAANEGFEAVWLNDEETGNAYQVTVYDFYDNIMSAVMGAIENHEQRNANRWNFLGFMTPEGTWAHGRIRDFISRATFVACGIQVIRSLAGKGKGQSKSNPVDMAIWSKLVMSAVSAYISTTMEYGFFIVFDHLGMPEEPARYAASLVQSAALYSFTNMVYPAVRDKIVRRGRRLSDGTLAQVEYILDILDKVAVEDQGNRVYKIKFNTMAAYDSDMKTNLAIDHFVNRCEFRLDMPFLKDSKKAGGKDFYVNAFVGRSDNPKVDGTCFNFYGYSNCVALQSFTSTFQLSTKLNLSTRI